MSSSSLVTGTMLLGCIGSSQPGHRTIGKVSGALSIPRPESRQHESIGALWHFPADVGKAVAVTFLQPGEQKNGRMDRRHRNT